MGVPAKKPNLAQYSRETVLDDEQVEAWLGLSADTLMSVGVPFVDERDWCLGGLTEEYRRCPHCRGSGGWWYCCAGREWCDAHPMAGREGITSTAPTGQEIRYA